MKKMLLLLLLLAGGSSLLMAGQFGLGITAGQPTGLNGKFWLDQKSAIEGVVGWSYDEYYDDYYYDKYWRDHHSYYGYEKRNSLYLHVDYRMHHQLVKQLYFVYGVGGKMVFHDDVFVGVRIPLGLNYQFKEVPLDLGLDIVPVLNLVPETDFDFDPCITLRFTFPK